MNGPFLSPYFYAGVLALLLFIAYLIVARRRKTVTLNKDEFAIWKAGRFGRFELRSFITRGDFNTTFKAFDRDRNKEVAVRILSHEFASRDSIIEQFGLKGELLKFLASRFPEDRFIQNVQSNAETVNGEVRPYIVSDYINGASLAEILRLRRKLSPRDTYRIIRGLAASTSLAHSQRVWLHEYSPKNFLLYLDDAGQVKLLIANLGLPYRHLPADAARDEKMYYYSPEDRAGQEANELSDVYALAALAFRMLEGYEFPGLSPGQALQGPSALLESALSLDPTKRPLTMEQFVEQIISLDGMKSSVSDVRWSELVPRLLRKREDQIVKEGEPRRFVSTQMPRLHPTLPSPVPWPSRFVQAILDGGMAAIFLWFGQKIESILASPKKAILTVGIVLGGVAILIWRILSPVSGDVVFNVIELSDKAPRLSGVPVIVEVYDVKTNTPISDVEFTNDRYGSHDGRVIWKTNAAGILKVHYKIRMKTSEVLLSVSAKPDDGYIPPVAYQKRLDSVPRNINLQLRPFRKGTIAITPADVNHLTLPGFTPAGSYVIDVKSTEPGGAPSANAKFILDGVQLPLIGEGHWQSAKQSFKLNVKRNLVFEVGDGAKISVQLLPQGGGAQLEYESVPAFVQVKSPSSAFNVVAQLKRQTAADMALFSFTLLDQQGQPAVGVEVFLNGQSLGKTSQQGRVTHVVNNLSNFWAQPPILKFDLSALGSAYRMSKDFQLTEQGDREITIHMNDILPF